VVTAVVSARPRRSFLRSVSGVLAGGIVVLAIGLGVAWVLAGRYGTQGPAGDFLAWHGVAAVVVIGAQLRADGTIGGRHAGERDPMGAVAALLVLLVAVLLGTLWFS
jgi:hypothetical protein